MKEKVCSFTKGKIFLCSSVFALEGIVRTLLSVYETENFVITLLRYCSNCFDATWKIVIRHQTTKRDKIIKLWLIPSKQISTNSYLKSNKDVKHWKDKGLVRKWNNNEDPLQLKNHSSVPIPKKNHYKKKLQYFTYKTFSCLDSLL